MSDLESVLRQIIRDEMRSVLREILVLSRAEPDEYLSLKRAAKIADVDARTLRRWIREGQLTAHVTPGGLPRILRSELDRALMPSRPADDLAEARRRARALLESK